MTPSTGLRWPRPGKGTGRIFGGCLPCIHQLVGSKYMPDYTGPIALVQAPTL